MSKTVTVLRRRIIVPEVFADLFEDGEEIGDVIEVVTQPPTLRQVRPIQSQREEPERRFFIAPWD
jgi:hypothetical protein